MDYIKYNRKAWDNKVLKGDKWTQPVSTATIENAKEGIWEIVLTPTKPVPREWFPTLKNKRVLCLASGGGQQGPILAATGAIVTVFDNSPNQLKQDQFVAKRDNLEIITELGSINDLSRFKDEYFDLIFHPAGGSVQDILSVWKEAYRILKKGSDLLSGFTNPIHYVFDLKAWETGELVIRHIIPYSDLTDLTEKELKELILDRNEPIFFGHSLHSLIQGQIDAGFMISGFYEDNSGGNEPLDKYIDSYIATKATKIGLKQ